MLLSTDACRERTALPHVTIFEMYIYGAGACGSRGTKRVSFPTEFKAEEIRFRLVLLDPERYSLILELSRKMTQEVVLRVRCCKSITDGSCMYVVAFFVLGRLTCLFVAGVEPVS
jgi:hypothetical protein